MVIWFCIQISNSEVAFSFIRRHGAINITVIHKYRSGSTGWKRDLPDQVYCGDVRLRKTFTNAIKYDEFPFWVLQDLMRLNENPGVCSTRQKNDDINTVKSRHVVELKGTVKKFQITNSIVMVIIISRGFQLTLILIKI